MKLKILFISHSYPPILGGVENQNFNLANNLAKIARVKIIANGKGKKWLPFFIPMTFLESFFLMSFYDACLVGNGVLTPLARTLKFFHPKKKFFSVIHGLDITFIYKKGILAKIYKKINIPSIRKMDKLFMVGNFTLEEAVKVDVCRKKSFFIPNGVDAKNLKKEHSREELSEFLGIDTKNKKIILRLGRFVPHKGTDWFIANIMPKLSSDTFLVATGYRVKKKTAGDPDNFSACQEAIQKNNLEKRVKILPNLSQDKLEILLNTVDLVVSPNINYPGSSEGFGINVIEAAACERIVIASDLQGLKDAIKNGKSGFLVEAENTEQWIKEIKAIFSAGPEFSQKFGEMAREYVEKNFSWEEIAKRYLEEMKKTFNK